MCQFWYKGASKRFAEIMYLTEAVQTEVFFKSYEWLKQRSIFEMLESSLLKIFSSKLWGRMLVFHLKNKNNDEGSEQFGRVASKPAASTILM